MRDRRIVLVVGKSSALDTALDALADLGLAVRVLPTAAEAERAVLDAGAPQVSAVLVSLCAHPSEGLRLIESVRAAPGFTHTPIAAWAPAENAVLLADAYEAGATSGVLVDGSYEDPIRLARMVHYWAAGNVPPQQEFPA